MINEDIMIETRRQYLHYFRIWFVIILVFLAVTIYAGIRYQNKPQPQRNNPYAPKERVYDLADVLTDEEEQKLREYIAKKETEVSADFVIYTFSQEVEGEEAMEKYHYDSVNWERNMRDIADDFWDLNRYGFNQGFEGDGSILIDNRYPGQRGEWLSTSGKVEYALSSSDVEDVLYAVDEYYDSNPYRAYKAYIDEVCNELRGFDGGIEYYIFALVSSSIVAAIYAAVHLKKNNAKDTTSANTYVAGGRPSVRSKDQYIRKSVIKRHIESSSGSGGGGGGHHTSHSGASHGGGGHRH